MLSKNVPWKCTFDYSYLKYFKSIDGLKKVINTFKKIEKLKLSVIGEPIIDNYVFGEIKGLTSKDPAISILKEKQADIEEAKSFIIKAYDLYKDADDELELKDKIFTRYNNLIEHFN